MAIEIVIADKIVRCNVILNNSIDLFQASFVTDIRIAKIAVWCELQSERFFPVALFYGAQRDAVKVNEPG